MMRLTPAVKNFLILNIGVFILQWLVPVISHYGALHDYRTADFFATQFFTYMFLHAGIGHIFANMLGLYFMGPILESTIGDKKFIMLYIICGLGAAITQVFITTVLMDSVMVPMVGASGAVVGILIGTALFYPNIEVMLYFLFPLKLKYLAIGIVAYDLLMGAYNANSHIAHFAHFGGALFAVILIKIWKDNGGLFR